MRATHIWGETQEEARDSAAKGNIPEIVADWRQMAGVVDGVMIDHRHPKDHAEVASFFIERGIPTFVDKPMTATVEEARALFRAAEKKKTPLCTFTAIPLQSRFRRFAASLPSGDEIQAINVTGPADIESRYGGIFFYGIHQVDTVVDLLGTEARSAHLQKNGANGVATILFSNGRFATINCIAEKGVFHWRVCTAQGVRTLDHKHDANAYLNTARRIYDFIRYGKLPWSMPRMLAPVAILEALQKSLHSGRAEPVAEV